jgi:nitrate reductase NapE component
MGADQQLATLRQVMEVKRMLRRHELILFAIIAIQLINLIVGLSRL